MALTRFVDFKTMCLPYLLQKTLNMPCAQIINRIHSQPHFLGVKNITREKLESLNLPAKPKRPLTAYFKFVQLQRQQLLNGDPNLKITEITKKCAEDWRKIDPSLKEKLTEEFKHDLDKYKAALAVYTDKLSEEQKDFLAAYKKEVKNDKKKRVARKLNRDHDKPKRPIGSYMLYVIEQAKNKDSVKYVELLRSLKDEWAVMPEEVKAKYTSTAQKLKDEYEKDLAEWEKKMLKDGNSSLVRRKTLESLKKSDGKLPQVGKVVQEEAKVSTGDKGAKSSDKGTKKGGILDFFQPTSKS